MANEKDKKLDQQQEAALFENQKIVNVSMEKEVKKSFIEYSMSVIMARALPDVRDGMKPGARRILYAMYEDGLVHFFPQADWIIDALHEKIMPLPGHVPTNNFTDLEKIDRAKKGL